MLNLLLGQLHCCFHAVLSADTNILVDLRLLCLLQLLLVQQLCCGLLRHCCCCCCCRCQLIAVLQLDAQAIKVNLLPQDGCLNPRHSDCNP
jgi:hypothetical protein